MQAADDTEALEARLENWGCAISGRKPGPGGTESVEGRYRSPQHWHALGPPQTSVEIDHDDAQIVESAVVLIPLFHHALLRAWYVRRLAPATCVSRARAVGGANSPAGFHFPQHLARAHDLIGVALALPAVIRRDRARAYVRRLLDLGEQDPMRGLDDA